VKYSDVLTPARNEWAVKPASGVVAQTDRRRTGKHKVASSAPGGSVQAGTGCITSLALGNLITPEPLLAKYICYQSVGDDVPSVL